MTFMYYMVICPLLFAQQYELWYVIRTEHVN